MLGRYGRVVVEESDGLLRGWTLIQNKQSPVMMKVQKAKVAGSSDRRDASLVVCSHFFGGVTVACCQ
jgi:hypothetical protein